VAPGDQRRGVMVEKLRATGNSAYLLIGGLLEPDAIAASERPRSCHPILLLLACRSPLTTSPLPRRSFGWSGATVSD
jgi:hypothetical protein